MNTKNLFARKLLPSWLNNLGGWIFIFSVMYLLVYLSWIIFRWGGEENITLLGDLFYIPIELVTAVVLLWAATRPDLSQKRRRAWWFFGLALLSYLLADLSWAYIEIVLEESPFPSVADIFYLAYYPLMLVGMLNLTNPMQFRRKYDRQRYWLDLVIAALASMILIWNFVIADTLAENAGDLATAILAAAYPIGDLILITGLLAVWFRRPESTTRSVLGWVFLSLLLVIGGDIVFAYTSLQGAYFSGSWIDIAWMLAFLVLQLAALRQLRPIPEKELTKGNQRLEQFGRLTLSGIVIFSLVLVLYLGLIKGFADFNVSWLTIIALLVAGLIGWRFLGTRGFTDLSLRNKLVTSFLIVTLIPLAGLAYYSILVTRQILTDEANTVLNSSATQTAAALDVFFSDGLNNVRTASQSYIWQEFLALPVLERAGSELEYKTNIDLRALARRDQIFIESVGLMDKNGIDVADTSSGEIGSNKSTHKYVSEPLRTGQSYSSVQLSPTTGKFSVYFSAPVRNTDGDIIGVLRIRYKADVLQQIVTQSASQLGVEGLEILLLDENHIRLAVSNDPSLILKSVTPFPVDKLAQLQTEFRLPAGLSAEELSTNLPEFEEGLNTAASQPIFEAELRPETIDVEDSIEQIAAVKMETQPWWVVTAQPKNVYTEPVVAQIRTIAVIVLFVVLVVALAAVAVARLLSDPIVRLRDVANQIADGDLQVQMSVNSRDETGQLAVAFNQMTDRLRETLIINQRRAFELATVAEVGTATSTILEVDQLLQNVVDLTKERFNLYHSHIYLLDDKGENLVLAKGAGEPGRQMLEKGLSIPLNREQSLVARAARERKGITVNDVRQAPDFLPNPLLPDTRSELAVPLVVGDKVIGVFDVQSDIVGRFTDADIDIQTTLASQVAVSVQNARQYNESMRFKLGIERSGDAVFATDTNGTITYANPAFEKVYGYSPAEVIGKNPRIIKSGLLNQENYQYFWGALLAKQSVTGEIINKHKDGHLVYIAGTNSAIVNESGEIVGFLAVHHDITEQRKNQDLIAQRARQQEALNLITQKIQNAATIETALQIAARELGHALGNKLTLVTLDSNALEGEHKPAAAG